LRFLELGTDTCQISTCVLYPLIQPVSKSSKKSPSVYNHGSQKYGKVKELGKEPPVLHQLKVVSWKSLVPQLEHKYWKFEFTHHHGNVNTI